MGNVTSGNPQSQPTEVVAQVEAGALPDKVVEFVFKYIEEVRKVITSGVTLGQLLILFEQGILGLADIVKGFQELTPDERVRVITDAGMMLYDHLIAPIDIPGLPDAVVDPLLRHLLKAFLDWALRRMIDFTVTTLQADMEKHQALSAVLYKRYGTTAPEHLFAALTASTPKTDGGGAA